jgi:methionyl-tRNA synthetase
MNPVFIGGAWPYANGSLHVGQIAALLPADVLARYFRLKGHPVLYVSGTDCHGTPITVRADREKVSPRVIADRYHSEFVDVFSRLGFSYDCYSRTDSPQHRRLVQTVFLALWQKGLLDKRTVSQVYCPSCSRFLPDRYIAGRCPLCGAAARGDQCDACTSLLNPEDLLDPACQLCGQKTQLRESEHFHLRLSESQTMLTAQLEQCDSQYRPNARQETARYLREGLQDRAITRDLDWGIPVPLPGYEGKKIYVWVDAVLGYLSASQSWAEQNGRDWRLFWAQEAQSWYVHGKDNIVFHTLILPALLDGFDPELKKPDHIVSSGYLTLEGQKISTSRNWAVWAADLLDSCPADSIRYFLISNNPEKRDADFSQHAFLSSHNGELLGAFGNFVYRTFAFVKKYRDGVTPNEPCDPAIRSAIEKTYSDCDALFAGAQVKKALERVFLLVRALNRFFDQRQPWRTRHDDPDDCDRSIATCLHGIVNLAQLLEPFLPFSCARIRQDLGITDAGSWAYVDCPCGRIITRPTPLYQRYDTIAPWRSKGKAAGDSDRQDSNEQNGVVLHRVKVCDNKAG